MRSGTVRTICTSTSPARPDGANGASVFARHLLPAHTEVLSHIRYDGTLQASARVVPADGRASRMPVGVEAITRLRREVDPTDESHTVVDHDGLFVMAVHRPLLRVQCTLDLRVTG